jgi:hypothetical protein
MTPSAKLQAHLKKRVTETGGQYRKVRWEYRRGCPDCFVFWPGRRFAFIEVKAGKDVVRHEQMREIARLEMSDIPVFVVRTEEEIEEAIGRAIRGA